MPQGSLVDISTVFWQFRPRAGMAEPFCGTTWVAKPGRIKGRRLSAAQFFRATRPTRTRGMEEVFTIGCVQYDRRKGHAGFALHPFTAHHRNSIYSPSQGDDIVPCMHEVHSIHQSNRDGFHSFKSRALALAGNTMHSLLHMHLFRGGGRCHVVHGGRQSQLAARPRSESSR